MLRKNAGARATYKSRFFCGASVLYLSFLLFSTCFPQPPAKWHKTYFQHLLICITHPTFSHFLPTILLLYLCTSQVDFFHYCASTETKRPSEPNSTHRWFGCLLLNASHSRRPKALTPSLYEEETAHHEVKLPK